MPNGECTNLLSVAMLLIGVEDKGSERSSR